MPGRVAKAAACRLAGSTASRCDLQRCVAVVLPCSDLGELLEALSCGGASIEELDLSRNDITDTGALPLRARRAETRSTR